MEREKVEIIKKILQSYSIIIDIDTLSEKCVIPNSNIDEAAIAIYKSLILDTVNVSNKKEEEVPILVGSLNKVFGYNGYRLSEVGTPVYEYKDKYYFEIVSDNGKITNKMSFYKEDLYKCITFKE